MASSLTADLTATRAIAMPASMTQDQIYLLVGAVLLLAVIYLLARWQRQRPTDRISPDAGLPKTAAEATAAEAPVPEAPSVAPGDSPFLPAPDGEADDLGRIKGIGPKLSTMLTELGVFHYRQIAAWTPEQLAHVDSQLGRFQGRPERDQWQSQAQLLADGDIKAYERAHGKLGPADPNSASKGPAA